MDINAQSNIGQIVAHDYRTASVFKSYKIDFCCNGNRTIQDACTKSNVNINELLEALISAKNEAEKQTDFNSWPLDLLADYIEKKHHRYVESKILEIQSYLHKIAEVHGNVHPELHIIKKLFSESAGELAVHMKKEELVLFPFVRKMVAVKQQQKPLSPIHFGTVENPIAMMKHEHDLEGERFREIAKLSNDYTPPTDACNTYRVAFALLKEFEDDLHEHIHLENNILFPKSVNMEKELNVMA